MRIAYLVHNVSESAVAKRVAMLQAAGVDVTVIGFCRESVPPTTVGGAPVLSLGRTFDAALKQRTQQVMSNLFRLSFWRRYVGGNDAVIARNLEMLMLGWVASRFSGVPRLVYEDLDIHRSLLGSGSLSAMLRSTERWLVARCQLLIYSSPAFWQHYFSPVQQFATPHLLVENRVLDLSSEPAMRGAGPDAGPPWTIGWFGNLRCRKSLARLRALADLGQGKIRILIAGKPSLNTFPDFENEIAHPQISYAGPYRAGDLGKLYGQCHFAWSLDYFEEGQNSRWLLPNRIYEAAFHGSVPIALDDVETGHWLARHDAGLRIGGELSDAALAAMICAMDAETYSGLRMAIDAIPESDLVARREDCVALANQIVGGACL